jgi:protein phosphatase
MKITVYGETNVGRQRDHNEDAFLILCDLDHTWQEVNDLQVDLSASKGLFLVVADGMGGANAGEVASSIAVKKVEENIKSRSLSLIDEYQVQKYLTSIVFDAHNSIVRKARKNDDMKGMGTTMVLGYVVNNTLYLVWAGDSRVYIYNASRHTKLVPFSDDHSLVWNRVKNGEITAEEARLRDDSNLILNALGDSFQKPVPEFKKTKLEAGDRIILCSDGLNSMLSDSGIQQIIDYNSNTKETCQTLISAACNAGGKDNITVLVADVLELESPSQVAHPKKRKGRKWLRFGLIMLLLAFLASGVVYFSNDIASFVTNHIKLYHQAANKEDDAETSRTDEILPAEPEEAITGANASGKPEQLNGNRNSETSEKIIASAEKTDPTVSTVIIKEDLEAEYKRIDRLMDDLMRYKPGGDMYIENVTFCRKNEKTINILLHKLDSIKGQIETVVHAPGNKIVSVKDQSKAIVILKTLKVSVDSLDNLKEKILTNTKN